MKKQHPLLVFLFSVFFWAASLAPASSAFAASASGSQGVMRGAVNINTATAEELQQLPGIGPKRADDIVLYRVKHPFTRVSQLAKIKGIGPKTLKDMQPYIVLEGPTDLQRVPDDKKGNNLR